MNRLTAILDDDSRRTDLMTEELQKLFPDVRVVVFNNVPEIIAWLRINLQSVDLLSLDHDLGPNRVRFGTVFDPGNGRTVANFLARRQAHCSVLIHSSNTVCADGMQFALEESDWSVERIVPYDDLSWIKEEWLPRAAAIIRQRMRQDKVTD